MIVNRYVRILLVLGMAVLIFGTMGDALGIIAETPPSDGAYPACIAPCECMTENAAGLRWGADGYEYCSKSICGESPDAMVQYYCLHQKAAKGTPVSATQVQAAASPLPSRETVQALVTTSASREVPATANPSSTQPPSAVATKKSPGSSVTLLAAIGLVMLAAAGMRRK